MRARRKITKQLMMVQQQPAVRNHWRETRWVHHSSTQLHGQMNNDSSFMCSDISVILKIKSGHSISTYIQKRGSEVESSVINEIFEKVVFSSAFRKEGSSPLFPSCCLNTWSPCSHADIAIYISECLRDGAATLGWIQPLLKPLKLWSQLVQVRVNRTLHAHKSSN